MSRYMYTEDELNLFSRTELMEIVKDIAKRVNIPVNDIVPGGARKETLVDAIMEDQEVRTGS